MDKTLNSGELVWNTQLNAIQSRDWAAGARAPAERRELIVELADGEENTPSEMWFQPIVYSAALLKCVDEPLVNAIDQCTILNGADHTRPEMPGNAVRNISVEFVRDTDPAMPWRISIGNDGRGIPTGIHAAASRELGRQVHIPTVWFGHLYQGSNTVKDARSITGGANGMGAKISNIFSHRFQLETCCDGVFFSQEWREGMTIELPPAIRPRRGQEFTRITFWPNLSLFSGAAATVDAQSDFGDMQRLLYTRTVMAATYLAHLPGVKPRITYNGTGLVLDSTQLARLAATHFEELGGDRPAIYTFTLTPKPGTMYEYPIECTVMTRGGITMGNVNGIVIREQSSLLALVRAKLSEGVAALVQPTKKSGKTPITVAQVSNSFSLFVNGRISCASWDGQGKNILNNDKRGLNQAYTIPESVIAAIAPLLREAIAFDATMQHVMAKKRDRIVIDPKKYSPATEAGGRNRAKCHLIITEGDSAKNAVIDAVTENRGMTRKYYGVMTSGGVIMNVRKQCHWEKLLGREFLVDHPKLAANQFFTSLMQITGLKYNVHYDPATPTFAREMAGLHYGTIDMAVDQDLDGLGMILGQFLNAFAMIWPRLFESGYVRWFPTPIIRAYPNAGGQVESFYHIPGFTEWQTAQADRLSKYKIVYYKGLGSHSSRELVASFAEYEKRILTFTLDNRAKDLFEIYHGASADARKIVLGQVTRMISPERVLEQYATGRILCSELLEQDVCLFQKDNLSRKLDNYVDGLNQVARKILHGAMQIMTKSRTMKVADLAGQILGSQNYDHGPDSLSDALVARGFIGTGGRQLPMFLPHGNWGSRFEGGADHSPARYISAEYNGRINDLIYPAADYELLHFERREGRLAEPQSFIPIIPTSILESCSLPAHGWAITIWARDVHAVITTVQSMILNPNYGAVMPRLPLSKYAWQGRIREWGGNSYTCGEWHRESEDSAWITITELPLRTWTSPYISWLIAHRGPGIEAASKQVRLVEQVQDFSTRAQIKIRVELTPAGVALLSTWSDRGPFNSITRELKLVERVTQQLNYTTPECTVRSFDTYESVVRAWFPYRQALYGARIERQLILLRLFRDTLYPNILRYIYDETLAGRIRGAKGAEQERLLGENGYMPIDVARLNNPGLIPNAELVGVIIPAKPLSEHWSYLLGMTDRKKSIEHCQKIEGERVAAARQIEDLEMDARRGRFPGAALWSRELAELQRVIRKGQASAWDWGRSQKYKI